MKMGKRVVILLVINLYLACSSTYNLNRLMKREEKFCGSRLTNMLSLVCNGNYYAPAKKSYSGFLNYNEYEDGGDNDIEQNDLTFPFLQKEYVKSLIPRKLRKTVGIVNECCYKPCSREHLQLYCGV